jgi:hypothetical protein
MTRKSFFVRYQAGTIWAVALSLTWCLVGNNEIARAENGATKMTLFRRHLHLKGKDTDVAVIVTRTWIDEMEKLEQQNAIKPRYAITDVYEITLTPTEGSESISIWTRTVQSRDTDLPHKLNLPLGTYLQFYDVIFSSGNVLVFLCIEHGDLQLMKVPVPATNELSPVVTVPFPVYENLSGNQFPKILGARLVAYPVRLDSEKKMINQFYVLVSVLSGPQNGVHVWVVKDDKPKRLELSEPEDGH